ncbi:hypothetical protein [Chryseobacterium sp. S90]|uniref:hypothetical protein n=1 Tax=Chryseobacterium sp. S90 TaxID=3395373 RepID=UPI0039BC783A
MERLPKKTLILTIIWIAYSFTDYFILPYFFKPLLWLLACLILLILSLRQIVKRFKERTKITSTGIISFLTTIVLFFLTFYRFNKIPSSIIEKLDWKISYYKRHQIVNEILKETIKPNTSMKNGIHKLSFDFPIISNGGNDIWIYENKTENTKTIKFWISRGFFEAPQIYFIFTNDPKTKMSYEKLIKNDPELNWKLEDQWYRIVERY